MSVIYENASRKEQIADQIEGIQAEMEAVKNSSKLSDEGKEIMLQDLQKYLNELIALFQSL